MPKRFNTNQKLKSVMIKLENKSSAKKYLNKEEFLEILEDIHDDDDENEDDNGEEADDDK